MSQLNDGTASSLIAFLENLAHKGRATQDTIYALKTATTKVLSTVQGDDWKKTDITKLDVSDTMDIFKIKTAGTYNDASLYTYTTRLRRAISWYGDFLKNPGFTPPLPQKRSPRQGKSAKPDLASSAAEPLGQPNEQSATSVSASSTPGWQSLVPYAFTLRRDSVVTLHLPAVITTNDSIRLKKFIESLVLDEAEE